MKKVGLWLRYGYTPSKGGGFSYYDALLRALANSSFKDFEICLVSPAQRSASVNGLETINLGLLPNKFPLVRRIVKNHRWAKLFLIINSRLFKNNWQSKLKKANVSFMYYVTQSDYVLNDFPFVTTVWDMGYIVTYPFPELIQGYNYIGRRRIFTQILPKALMVFCESEAGKSDLVKYANVCEDKIRVLPIFAGNVIKMNVSEDVQKGVLRKYGLKKNYFFFYPAQFWAHKNHIGILKAFKSFLSSHVGFKMLFTGGDKGNLQYVKHYCNKNGLSESVLFLGFVENDEIYTFYKNAASLIMASYFGPTNMPPIEAMYLDCPVICSDIEGHREIMGDAALYFNPYNTNQLVSQMEKMEREHEKYRSLVVAQRKNNKFDLNYSLLCLETYFTEALTIRETWN